MKADQKEIYYLSGDNRLIIERNPNLEYFQKKEIEVLFLSDPIDVLIIPSISEYDQKPIKSIEKADIDLMPEDQIDKPEDNLSKDLLSLFKDVLKEKVTDVVPFRGDDVSLVGQCAVGQMGRQKNKPGMFHPGQYVEVRRENGQVQCAGLESGGHLEVPGLYHHNRSFHSDAQVLTDVLHLLLDFGRRRVVGDGKSQRGFARVGGSGIRLRSVVFRIFRRCSG